jgi:hypothetical protein
MTETSLKDELEEFELLRIEGRIEDLQWRCFHLERDVDRLKYYPNRTKDQKRALRMRRMELRHELAMLRIDAESLVEEATPILNS